MVNKWISENIPAVFKAAKTWVYFIFTPQPGKKPKKEPMNPATGGHAMSNEAGTWASFEKAEARALAVNADALGSIILPGHTGVDLDGCVKDGVILPIAQKIMARLNTYTEFSPSGTGIHLIMKGAVPKDRKFTAMGVEIYSGQRFLTFTGHIVPGCCIEVKDLNVELNQLYDELVREEDESKAVKTLLAKIGKSNDSGFLALYEGKWEGTYPSQSEADLAFCSKLAFWSGKDEVLMDTIFRKSGLIRPKWDEKHFSDGRTYGQAVIQKAIEGCQESYGKALGPSTKRKYTQGEIITRDCEENIKDFFRDQHGNGVVVVPVAGHDEVCPTASVRFRNWKATRFREKYGMPPKTDAINQAKIQIEARCAVSRQMDLFNRVGWHEGRIWFDLTTADHQGVVINKDGWSVAPLAPIFRRYQHQASQVMPVLGGNPRDLLQFCNILPDDHCLLLVIVASYFIPDIPHVIISQNGEQGSGKSNNSRKIKGLVDPSRVMLISSPKDLEQAQMTAEKQWVCAFDNISKIQEWYSDFLCRGVTGEGDMKRSLYTNDDEFIRSYRRCFVLNGIGASMWRPDLLDRSVIFDIPLLKSTQPEHVMEDEWSRLLPGILGGFFTAISKAMGVVGGVNGHQKFRMSDFARWGAALAQAFGYTQEEFFKKYQESVNRKWQETAEDSSFARKIRKFIEKRGGYWSGAAAELMYELGSDDGAKDTPKNAKWLSTELIRIAPVMRNVGIDIVKRDKREGGTGRRIFVIKKVSEKICEQGCEQSVSNELFCEDDDGYGDEKPF